MVIRVSYAVTKMNVILSVLCVDISMLCDSMEIYAHYHDKSGLWGHLHKVIYEHEDNVIKAIRFVWDKSWERNNAKSDRKR